MAYSPDDDALVLVLDQHVPIHAVCQRPNVGGILVGSLHMSTSTVGKGLQYHKITYTYIIIMFAHINCHPTCMLMR